MNFLFAAGGPIIPSFGSAKSFACERSNGTFCWHWFTQNWGMEFPRFCSHLSACVCKLRKDGSNAEVSSAVSA